MDTGMAHGLRHWEVGGLLYIPLAQSIILLIEMGLILVLDPRINSFILQILPLINLQKQGNIYTLSFLTIHH